jgi:hypothetical protein
MCAAVLPQFNQQILENMKMSKNELLKKWDEYVTTYAQFAELLQLDGGKSKVDALHTALMHLELYLIPATRLHGETLRHLSRDSRALPSDVLARFD